MPVHRQRFRFLEDCLAVHEAIEGGALISPDAALCRAVLGPEECAIGAVAGRDVEVMTWALLLRHLPDLAAFPNDVAVADFREAAEIRDFLRRYLAVRALGDHPCFGEWTDDTGRAHSAVIYAAAEQELVDDVFFSPGPFFARVAEVAAELSVDSWVPLSLPDRHAAGGWEI